MKKLTILVDMDDTIEKLLAAWLELLNERYGRSVDCEDILDWDITRAYPGLTEGEVYGAILERGFWERVEPIPGAAEALLRLKEAGHTIYLVTATPLANIDEKMNKLIFRYFPFFSWNDVIVTTHKTMLMADVMVDDGVHNLEGGVYRKILVDAPYNRAYDAEAGGMVRVYNWDEIEAEINRIANE